MKLVSPQSRPEHTAEEQEVSRQSFISAQIKALALYGSKGTQLWAGEVLQECVRPECVFSCGQWSKERPCYSIDCEGSVIGLCTVQAVV